LSLFLYNSLITRRIPEAHLTQGHGFDLTAKCSTRHPYSFKRNCNWVPSLPLCPRCSKFKQWTWRPFKQRSTIQVSSRVL